VPRHRPLLILAGAGSGRTAALSARVAWLVAQGLAPERILLLAFTRRAGREVLTRTRALLEARRRSSSTRRATGR
jgi:DNA helicase-2/ATP-dependent DNA helicase PcrA